MKQFLLALLLVAVTVEAKATVLPDACGDDKVKFDVKTDKPQPVSMQPAPGKARLVLVENEQHMLGLFQYATIRFGLDGHWAGANYSNSYFVIDVDPGEHHLCASWQSDMVFKKMIDATEFTAEAGKTYYFAANVVVTGTGGENTSPTYAFNMAPLNADEGKYRVKAWKLSVSKPKA